MQQLPIPNHARVSKLQAIVIVLPVLPEALPHFKARDAEAHGACLPNTHARTIECEVGPSCVAMHVPCPRGHYDCAYSTVRIFQLGPSTDKLLAQNRVLQCKLDDALRKLASARLR